MSRPYDRCDIPLPALDCEVTFDGRPLGARRGEPLWLTLAAYGMVTLGRSGKYHRPRGAYCGEGYCGQCLVRADGLPSRRACEVRAEMGLVAQSQNVLGTAQHDVLGSIDWLFPRGLDHHRLMTRSLLLNRLTVAVSRRLAGVGRVPRPASQKPVALRELNADVVVVGLGRAGSRVARVLAERGFDVVGLEQGDAPELPGVRCLGRTKVVGRYDETWVVAVSAEAQVRVAARATVVCTGSYELPPAVVGNDVPGVMSLGAARRALSFGVLPGRRVALLVAGDATATVRERAERIATELAAAGATVHVRAGSPLQRVAGRARVRRVLLADETLHVDALVWAPEPTPAYELPRQLGIACTYRDDLGAFVPESLANGLTEVPGVYLAGSVTGMGASHTLAGADEVADTVCAQLRDHAA